MKVILGAILLTLVLTGCSTSSEPTTPMPSPVSATPSQLASPTGTTTAPTEASLSKDTVTALMAICKDLSDYVKDPTNWRLDSELSAGAPYELALPGEGGTLTLAVTPGQPLADVEVSARNGDLTNTILSYAGCSSITTPPPVPQQQVSDNSGGSGQSQSQGGFTVPDFVGATEQDAKNWVAQNGVRATVMTTSYGANPYLPCTVGGYGIVEAQSVSPGQVLPNDGTAQVLLTVNCERGQ